MFLGVTGNLGIIFTFLLIIGFILNLILAFIIIFLERNRRSATSTWAWLFVLLVLPLIGFVLYFLVELCQSVKWKNIMVRSLMHLSN